MLAINVVIPGKRKFLNPNKCIQEGREPISGRIQGTLGYVNKQTIAGNNIQRKKYENAEYRQELDAINNQLDDLMQHWGLVKARFQKAGWGDC